MLILLALVSVGIMSVCIFGSGGGENSEVWWTVRTRGDGRPHVYLSNTLA